MRIYNIYNITNIVIVVGDDEHEDEDEGSEMLLAAINLEIASEAAFDTHQRRCTSDVAIYAEPRLHVSGVRSTQTLPGSKWTIG